MPTATIDAISSLEIRVNPGNAALMPDDADYQERYDSDFAAIKEKAIERISEAVAAGEAVIPVDAENPLQASEETAIAFRAHGIAQKMMRLNAALGGYGMVGKAESLNYFGVELSWIEDETIPVGEYVFEGVEDPQGAINYLATLAP